MQDLNANAITCKTTMKYALRIFTGVYITTLLLPVGMAYAHVAMGLLSSDVTVNEQLTPLLKSISYIALSLLCVCIIVARSSSQMASLFSCATLVCTALVCLTIIDLDRSINYPLSPTQVDIIGFAGAVFGTVLSRNLKDSESSEYSEQR